jgi:hypothetical protein
VFDGPLSHCQLEQHPLHQPSIVEIVDIFTGKADLPMSLPMSNAGLAKGLIRQKTPSKVGESGP